MATMFRYFVPAIGTKGIYELTAPYTTTPGDVYECIGVRTLGAYLANNDDALTEVYKSAGLTEDDYQADLKIDMEVVTLQNASGFCLRVPARFIASYPVQDGVFYRAMALSVFLPAMPVTQDLSDVTANVKDLVKSSLGVEPIVKPVEMSQVKMISQEQHENTQTARALIVGEQMTLYGQLAEKQRRIEELAARVQVLEEYILSNEQR